MPNQKNLRANSIQPNTPPTLAESSALSTNNKSNSRKLSERELLDEFKSRMTTLRTGSFAGLWEEAALIIEFEDRLCAGVKDEEKCQKTLRKLQETYVDEFDLPPTTAQRYKRVYRFFEPLVASEEPGTPTLETLAEIQMSKLDLLVALQSVKPDSWHFTDNGSIVLDHSVWTASNKDVRRVSVQTLREISKALNAQPSGSVVQQNCGMPAEEQTPDRQFDFEQLTRNAVPLDDADVFPAPGPYLSNDGTTLACQNPVSTDSTASASASLDVWAEYTVTSTAQDGKIRYPDPLGDDGYSERVFYAFNGNIEVAYDGTGNTPELRIRPVNPECEAHAVVWRPDSVDGKLPERTILYYDPAVGNYRPACLTMNN